MASGLFSFIERNQNSQSGFKVISYNVNKLRPTDTNNIRDEFTDWIFKNSYDILCLQEMIELNNAPFHLKGYNKIFSGKALNHEQLGLFIFSRYPIIRQGLVELGLNSFNRIIWADIVKESDTLRIINVHLKSYDFQGVSLQNNFRKIRRGIIGRYEHIDRLSVLVQSTPYPIVLCGDFNEVPYTYSYNEFKSILTDGYLASGKGYDYTYKFGSIPLRIDYIFVSPALKLSNYQVIHEAKWSDHLPVFAKIG
ncbi:MAG: endonuclease/exonuclease/phosphatase family protein [Cyclobacteriaceae bacterium]